MLAPWKERYGKHGSVLKNSYVKFKNKKKKKKKEKQRHHLADRGLSSQSYDFSSCHVWI